MRSPRSRRKKHERSVTERDAFLAEIIAHPEDDTPRLIFADWLEEHGEEERAEFIRVQCAMARISGCEFKEPGVKECYRTARPHSISCRWCQLKRREQVLLIRQRKCGSTR